MHIIALDLWSVSISSSEFKWLIIAIVRCYLSSQRSLPDRIRADDFLCAVRTYGYDFQRQTGGASGGLGRGVFDGTLRRGAYRFRVHARQPADADRDRSRHDRGWRWP